MKCMHRKGGRAQCSGLVHAAKLKKRVDRIVFGREASKILMYVVLRAGLGGGMLLLNCTCDWREDCCGARDSWWEVGSG